MFTVGGFARVAGVSAKVLRAWDGAGLFAPAWVDRSSGYRYYTPAQLPALRRILALRDVGMGLADIQALVIGGGDLRLALDRRRSELMQARRDVERQLAALDIRVVGGALDAPDLDVVLRHVPSDAVATFELGLEPRRDVGAAFYELEAHVRDLGVRAHRPPGVIAGEKATLFVPVRRAVVPTDRIGYRRLPLCRAATLLHRGSYASLARARRDLADWVARAGLSPAGAMRILYLQFGAEPELRLPRGWVVERAADLVTELQLPVT